LPRGLRQVEEVPALRRPAAMSPGSQARISAIGEPACRLALEGHAPALIPPPRAVALGAGVATPRVRVMTAPRSGLSLLTASESWSLSSGWLSRLAPPLPGYLPLPPRARVAFITYYSITHYLITLYLLCSALIASQASHKASPQRHAYVTIASRIAFGRTLLFFPSPSPRPFNCE
jgi:hypothetical protein